MAVMSPRTRIIKYRFKFPSETVYIIIAIEYSATAEVTVLPIIPEMV